MMTRVAWHMTCIVILLAGAARAAESDPAGDRFFESKVRPLLVEKCFQCHDDKKQRGEMRLDSRAALLQGGDSGPAIVAGEPDKSLLIKAIRYDDEDLQMPPKGKLSEDEIKTLTDWVKLGAPWPGDDGKAAPVRPKGATITDEDRQYWFFRPLAQPTVPTVKSPALKARINNPIDAFLLAKLEEAGLSYAPPAQKLTLIRRATFDLHGLPPTQAEIDAFLNDTSPAAYEKLLDRLLASPRYGERMARRWLDIVRYADSDGFRADEYRPHIWRYRDWVISAFNADMPYDQFVTHQLAGDEVKPGDPDALIAMGYLRLFPYEYNQRDVHKQWNEIIDDITGNVGEVFLGLSMHCARCHNHKFDPILQEDYFKLRAFFAPVLPDDTITAASPAQRAEYDRQMAAWLAKTAEIRAKIDAIEAPFHRNAVARAVNKFTEDLQAILKTPVDELPPFERQIRDLAYRQVDREVGTAAASRISGEKKAEYEQLQAELKKFDSLKPKPLMLVTAIRDVSATPPVTMIPGDRQKRVIEPGFLAVLEDVAAPPAAVAPPGRARAAASPTQGDDTDLDGQSTQLVAATDGGSSNDAAPKTGPALARTLPGGAEAEGGADAALADADAVPQATGRRQMLAHWLTRPDNAQATRVIVNRLWQYHFGAGIVATSNDFGRQGDRPTHPQLLDWLAREFVAQGWSIKKMHKTMMLTQAYQQASVLPEAANPASIAADPTAIDPANTLLWKQRSHRLEAEQIRDAMLAASGELIDTMHGEGVADGADRRSIYLKFMRNNRPQLIEVFDGPDGFNSVSRRNVTTIAPQSLMLMNGEWTLTRARKLAELSRKLGEGKPDRMIEIAHQRALGRTPTDQERADIREFLDTQPLAASLPEASPTETTTTKTPAPKTTTPAPKPVAPEDSPARSQGINIDHRTGQHLRLPDHAALKFEEFTVEAVFMLRSIDGNANVRTIASQWNGATDKPGWSIGVTGVKSKFMPQTIILQLVGMNEDGQRAYDVVVSGLKPQLNQLYHLTVRVRLSEQDSTGIAFHLRPLIENAPAQIAEVGHTVIRDIANSSALVIGGRDAGANKATHGFDGLLSNVRIYKEGLSPQQLVDGRSPKLDALIGDYRFAPDAVEKDASGRNHHLTGVKLKDAAAAIETVTAPKPAARDPKFEAFIDYCHVLLNSNEFLYVD